MIAASAQTRGCSDSRYPNTCFGKTRMEDRVIGLTVIFCEVVTIGIEVLVEKQVGLNDRFGLVFGL